MAATYNLKLSTDYQKVFDLIIKDIDNTNPVDGQGCPLDEFDNPITVGWLWKNYGHYLGGTQNSLGYQLFNEIIEHYTNK